MTHVQNVLSINIRISLTMRDKLIEKLFQRKFEGATRVQVLFRQHNSNIFFYNS